MGPPGFLCRESARHSTLLVPCGDMSASPSKGWRLAARACCHAPAPPQNPKPETRLPRQRREATPASPPSLPPHRSSCSRLCWNVTGVVARACPDSRNTCFSPQGFPRPPALFRRMAAGRLFLPRRPAKVTASTGPCGGCCPRAAAQLITGGDQAQHAQEPAGDLPAHSVRPPLCGRETSEGPSWGHPVRRKQHSLEPSVSAPRTRAFCTRVSQPGRRQRRVLIILHRVARSCAWQGVWQLPWPLPARCHELSAPL